ncbi:hypothetical protein BDV09DRAFT_181803 [Aspergillus tetrazonus]
MASPETHTVELPPTDHLNHGQEYPRITNSSLVRDLGPVHWTTSAALRYTMSSSGEE